MSKKALKIPKSQQISTTPQISKSPQPHERSDTQTNISFLIVCLAAIFIGITKTPAILANYWHVLLFYTIVVWIIHYFRHKFEWQGVAALYKTKIGLNAMELLSKPTRYELVGKILLYLSFPFLNIGLWSLLYLSVIQSENFLFLQISQSMLVIASVVYCIGLLFRPIKTFGVHAIYAGFIGMLAILVVTVKALIDFLFVTEAPPTFSLVIPGVPVPGTGLTLPLIYGWLGLFLIIAIHEFSHGVVARAHKIPVLSSGFFFFGPLVGAFVEPDEKKMGGSKKASLSIFAAGPFSNMILTGILMLLASLSLFGALSMTADNGFIFTNVIEDSPAYQAGLVPEKPYLSVNGQLAGANYSCIPLSTSCFPIDFWRIMSQVKANETVVVTDETGTEYVMQANPHPANSSRGVIGVDMGVLLQKPSYSVPFRILLELSLFFSWAAILSLGIGIANLLPIVGIITDGSHMFLLSARTLFGEKYGTKIWAKFGTLLIVLILVVLIGSLFRTFFA